MATQELVQTLTRPRDNVQNLAYTAGFLWGAISVVTTSNILENPISTIFCAAIRGGMYGLGAGIACAFIPTEYRAIVPIACAAASVNAGVQVYLNSGSNHPQ